MFAYISLFYCFSIPIFVFARLLCILNCVEQKTNGLQFPLPDRVQWPISSSFFRIFIAAKWKYLSFQILFSSSTSPNFSCTPPPLIHNITLLICYPSKSTQHCLYELLYKSAGFLLETGFNTKYKQNNLFLQSSSW